MPDLPTYVTYGKILAHVRDYVRRFYGNCRNLQYDFCSVLMQVE